MHILKQKVLIFLIIIIILFFVSACSMDSQGSGGSSDNISGPWQPVASGFHVKVDGASSGDGSLDAPWDLATALTNSSISPGAVIYLHGGTYNGVFVSRLNGTSSAPIKIRPWANDVVIIDGAGHTESNTPGILDFGGSYTWLSGITITNSAADHLAGYPDNATDGVYFIGRGNKLLNSVIRGNSGNGIGFWNPAVDAEVSGCIIYHNGAIGPGRGHGHGFYVQQGTTGVKTIRNNIIFNSFGKGIQVYGTTVEVHNTIIEDNIFFNAARAASLDSTEQNVIIGGIMAANNHIVRNNVFYTSPDYQGMHASARFGYEYNPNGMAEFTGNYSVDSFLHITREWDRVTARNNTYIARSSADRVVVGYDVYTRVTTRNYDRNVYHRGRIGENSATGFELHPLTAIQEYDGQESNSVYHENLPSQTAVFNKQVDSYGLESRRWHVAIYNWDDSQSVNVTLPDLGSGANYAVYYAPSLSSGPVATGNYNGSSISIPLSAAATDIPSGMQAHASRFSATLPFFGAFLIIDISPYE